MPSLSPAFGCSLYSCVTIMANALLLLHCCLCWLFPARSSFRLLTQNRCFCFCRLSFSSFSREATIRQPRWPHSSCHSLASSASSAFSLLAGKCFQNEGPRRNGGCTP